MFIFAFQIYVFWTRRLQQMQPADSEHSRHLRREEHLKRPSSDLNCNPLNHLCNGNLVNSCFGAFLKHCDDQGVLSYTLAKEAMKEVFSDAHQVDLDRIFESIERENLDGKERITFQRFLVIASSIVVFSDLKGSNLDHATPEKIHEVLTSKNLKAKRVFSCPSTSHKCSQRSQTCFNSKRVLMLKISMKFIDGIRFPIHTTFLGLGITMIGEILPLKASMMKRKKKGMLLCLL